MKNKRIYVQEIRNGKNLLKEGWIDEDTFIKLYGESNYKELIDTGKSGDSIGQGIHMFSQSEENLINEFEEHLNEINTNIEKNKYFLDTCLENNMNNVCEVYEKQINRYTKLKNNINKQYHRILSLKSK